MIFIPTRNRLPNLQRFIKAYQETKAKELVIFLFDEGDTSYERLLSLPDNFSYEVYPRTTRGAGEILNLAFQKHPNEAVYGVLADDVVPETAQWDRMLTDAAMACGGVSYADDGFQGRGLPTHPFLNGDMVRKLGWIACPKLKHCCVDDCWLSQGHIFGLSYLDHVKLTHFHPLVGKGVIDDTYRSQPPVEDDVGMWYSIKEELIRSWKLML